MRQFKSSIKLINNGKTLRTREEAERDLRLAIRSSHAACDEDQVVLLVLGLTLVNLLFPLVYFVWMFYNIPFLPRRVRARLMTLRGEVPKLTQEKPPQT